MVNPLNIFCEAHPFHSGLPGESLDDFRLVEEREVSCVLKKPGAMALAVMPARARPCFGRCRMVGYAA